MDLFTATRSKHVTRLVIFDGADINAQDSAANTPLHTAIKRAARVSVISELVRLGAQVNAINQALETPLFLSVRHPDLQVMEHLIEHDALIDGPRSLLSALHNAAFHDRFDRVEILLAHGADPNTLGPMLTPPLFAARSAEMAQRLILAGANPYLRDRKGRNTLDWMREKGHDDALAGVLGRAPKRPHLRLVAQS